MKHQALVLWTCLVVVQACQSTPPEASAPKDAPAVRDPNGLAAPSVPPVPPVPTAQALPLADPAVLQAAHSAALEWLANQQDSEGAWSTETTGRIHQVGLTGLALLALQSGGSTTSHGRYARHVARGVHWLMTRQDPKTGLIGERSGHSFHYEHAIATQAICRSLKSAPSDELRNVAQAAVGYVARARNPYSAWRYEYPPTGESDTSITGWMVEALVAGRDAGLEVDEQAFSGALRWVEEITDPNTARVGYDSQGSGSSRIVGLNDRFPTDRSEAMTASGMLTRMNAGQTLADAPILARHAGLLRTHPPEWDPAGYSVDEYYWYFGSQAQKRMGGADWDAWRVALQAALLPSQSTAGAEAGSWRAVGAWSSSVGSVMSTSLNALCLAAMS
jgi:hypothetical protein